MKIAILAKILNTKSGSRAPIELAKHLAKNNQVVFFARKENLDPKAKKNLEKGGVKVFLINWFELWPVLKKEKFEIISCHAPLFPTLITRLSGIPTISTYYGTQLDAYYEKLLPNQKPNLREKIFNWLGNQAILFLMRLRLSLAQQVVAISQYTAQEAKRLYGKKIPFVYLGVDSESLKPNLRASKNDRVVLLSVSRFTPYKGFHILIEVFKKLKKEFPQIKLTLVGSSSQKKYLDYLKKIKDKDVEILTNISDKNLSQEYQKSDIYVSWDHYLFFGLPVLEAALFGKPAVVLNHCAAPETVIHTKTGFLAKNESELLKCLKKLIKNRNLRKKMGLEAQKQAKKFSWNRCAQKYEKIFDQIK